MERLYWNCKRIRMFILVLTILAIASMAQAQQTTPVNFRVAFIADVGVTNNSKKVLQLIKDEKTDLLIILGDFDYYDDPTRWENMLNSILGENFPIFAAIGNHDLKAWDGNKGYQWYLQQRCQRLGITWEGDLGVKSTIEYKGLFIVLVGAGTKGNGHDIYLRDQLAKTQAIWRIAGWHKNMKRMQVGGKSNATGWGVYEEARKGGAIIATGHEHSYSRTHLLSKMQGQVIASTSDTLVITRGATFAFVSGLGGKSIRDQELSGDWWASIYTSDQGATYGALFGEFNYNGVPNLAHFYFKNIKGDIIDEFWAISQVQGNVAGAEHPPQVVDGFVLEQNYPNPFNPGTRIRFYAPRPDRVTLRIVDMLGRPVRTLFRGLAPAGTMTLEWDGANDAGVQMPSGTYFYQLVRGEQIQTRRLILAK
ncbi:MAG: metallophosphoesterase [candidate division KSB1 bacterium]|nr:metallophosphoesterase [candidate division KSB1 bacterium]MDQ7063067.1 metallophosphoesterase [candidate division KSB1 bacterium]